MRPTIKMILIVLLITPQDALAYIDPSAGGMIVQLLLAGIAGLGVVANLYWKKITSFFRRRSQDEDGQ